MNVPRPLLLTTITVLLFLSVRAQETPVPTCTEKTFAALRPLPKLQYPCSENLIDSDRRILRLPRRRAALARVLESLRSYTNPAWWEASVDDLNACELRGSAGQLSEEEQARWQTGDHSVSLFGSRRIRLMLIADPCYQVGFNGTNAVLLYRNDGRVTATQVLDGYYSRADNSVGMHLAELKGQQVIEITTGNSLPPSLVSYFFTLDRGGRAVRKKTFVPVGG